MKYSVNDIFKIGVKLKDNQTNKKWVKYDLLANELGLIYGFITRIISYVLTQEGLQQNLEQISNSLIHHQLKQTSIM